MLWQEMTWPAVAALDKTTPIVVPLAALEQHGHHLPLFVDSMLLGEVVRRVHRQMGRRAVFTPVVWLGNSDHHLEFAGTLSAPPRVYLDMVTGLLDNLIAHGFQRLLLLIGHGGNIVPGQQVVFEVRQKYRQRHDLLLLSAAYWALGAEPPRSDATIGQGRMGHACEWETSMMLQLAPELVGPTANLASVEFGKPFEPASRGWITADRTVPGHIGNPQAASAAKGETLFQLFSADVVALLERMIVWDGRSWNG